MAADEQKVIENILANCGQPETGRIRVSSVVDYLRSLAVEISEENLDALSVLLDPKRIDPDVDEDEFRAKASAWIRDIQEQARDADDVSDDDRGNASLNQADLFANWSAISADSIEGYGGETSSISKSWDYSELLGNVTEMKRHIEKLQSDKKKLQDQLSQVEDANIQLSVELEGAKRHSRTVESEMKLKKGELDHYEKTLDDVSKERNQLEKKNQALEANLADIQDQLKEKARCMETLEDEHRRLREEMEAQTSQRFEDGDSGSASLDQSIGSVDELLRIVQQLKSENQLLLRDKNELERSLIHVNERLKVSEEEKSLLPNPVFTSTPSRLSSSPRRRRRLEDDDNDDEGEEEIEVDGPVISGDFSSQCAAAAAGGGDVGGGGETSLHPLTSSFDQFTVIASQAKAQSHQRTERALQLVSELSSLDPSRNHSSEVVKTELEEDEISFRRKLEHFVKSKERTVEKLKKMHAKVERLTEEKQELTQKLEDARNAAPPDVPELEHSFRERIGNLSETVTLFQTKIERLSKSVRSRKESSDASTSPSTLTATSPLRAHDSRSCAQTFFLWAIFLLLAVFAFFALSAVDRFPSTASQCMPLPRGFLSKGGKTPQ